MRTTEQDLTVMTDNGQIARRNKDAREVELLPPPYIVKQDNVNDVIAVTLKKNGKEKKDKLMAARMILAAILCIVNRRLGE